MSGLPVLGPHKYRKARPHKPTERLEILGRWSNSIHPLGAGRKQSYKVLIAPTKKARGQKTPVNKTAMSDILLHGQIQLVWHEKNKIFRTSKSSFLSGFNCTINLQCHKHSADVLLTHRTCLNVCKPVAGFPLLCCCFSFHSDFHCLFLTWFPDLRTEQGNLTVPSVWF